MKFIAHRRTPGFAEVALEVPTGLQMNCWFRQPQNEALSITRHSVFLFNRLQNNPRKCPIRPDTDHWGRGG